MAKQGQDDLKKKVILTNQVPRLCRSEGPWDAGTQDMLTLLSLTAGERGFPACRHTTPEVQRSGSLFAAVDDPG